MNIKYPEGNLRGYLFAVFILLQIYITQCKLKLMNKKEAIKILWDYMHMNHPLKKVDLIFVLGSRDTSAATYAAELYHEKWAPYILFSGSGSIHNNKPGREKFKDTTEAEVFASIAQKNGVPAEAIIIENRSQNSGENFSFAKQALDELNITISSAIIIQKPYTERRAYATGKVHWPDIDIVASSQSIAIDDYAELDDNLDEHWIHTMVGDLQRIKEYPKQGFQIKQDIPVVVWDAYEYLISEGYTNRLIK